MIPTLDFLLPSLHPSTLLDVSFPITGPGTSKEPIVRSLPIKYGDHAPVGIVKRMLTMKGDQVLVADDGFRMSTLQLQAKGEAGPPEVIRQEEVPHRNGSTWTSLTGVHGGALSALSSGLLTYHPSSSSTSQSRTLSAPVTCLATASSSSTSFAVAGNGLEVSIWDVERTFAASGEREESMGTSSKRKKELEDGETWRAKNLPPNHLRLPQPVHHLAVTYLPGSEDVLATGTRLGTVRRYDTRAQRKPTDDWKVAREGGISTVAPGGSEHELFFSDRSGLLASLDLRTGKVAYTLPVSSTPQYLLPIPAGGRDTKVGLGSISSDATFRLHATSGVERTGNRGDKEKWTRGIVSVAGGVGGEGIWRGWGEMEEEKPEKVRKEGEEDEGESEDEEVDEEEVWEEMSEVEDAGEEASDEDDDEEEEEEQPVKTKKRRQA